LAEPSPVELNFYDLEALPGDIVEALADRLDKLAAGLSIKAYHAPLAHQLMRLDMPVLRVDPAPPVAEVLPQACRAVALAGSAQSLDKICYTVSRLPVVQVAVFVLQHVQENQLNQLDKLLRTRTDYRVVMPQHLMAVEPGTLYVAPPGHHMKVAHGLVYLTRDAKRQWSRPSIDALFESLAAEYGAQVMAMLFCGLGSDGVEGCAALKKAGALVLVEDGDECGIARAMPDAVRYAGHSHLVLKRSGLASVAACVLQGDPHTFSGEGAHDNALLDLFLEALFDQYSYDLRSYQRDSLMRRVKQTLLRLGWRSLAQFVAAVLSDPRQFELMCIELPVGVSSFFRHPEQWQELRETVLPSLNSFPLIKLWCAGCSTGEEAYSLAWLMDEFQLLDRCHLFATDINPHALDQARTGLFPRTIWAQSQEQYRQGGGAQALEDRLAPGSRFLRASERLRQAILFYRHSLLESGSFNEFQLIICRNVMIYFDANLQREVLHRFARSLHEDGFLVLGPQDGLAAMALEAGFVACRPGGHIYRRVERIAHV
ncbi:MAG: hypothetical protein JO370_03970, partial [Paucibacter sp.]|nr:hypothetical protein [Roseateles sp.]